MNVFNSTIKSPELLYIPNNKTNMLQGYRS